MVGGWWDEECEVVEIGDDWGWWDEECEVRWR